MHCNEFNEFKIALFFLASTSSLAFPIEDWSRLLDLFRSLYDDEALGDTCYYSHQHMMFLAGIDYAEQGSLDAQVLEEIQETAVSSWQLVKWSKNLTLQQGVLELYLSAF